MLEKVLVANRGEIALHVIRACRELDVPTVAVYSDADSEALHVRQTDEADHIGPPPAAKSYLRSEVLIEAAQETGADAIHPGYGFLAENAEFAAACREAGLTFVGPSAEAIQKMGDKSAARRIAEEAGVPVVPGTDGVGPEEAIETAREIGYPVMDKGAAGGGGRGIRIAESDEELEKSVRVARQEAESAFGDGSVYLEKFLAAPRHVEVQVLGDHSGNAIHLYERECSMQRRRQKVLEEAPSPGISSETRRKMLEAAVRLTKEAGYANAGTIEFLVDEDGSFYFIEMNTRVQVEHPITEMLTGVDLIKAQLKIASGEPLELTQDEVPCTGWAMEFRINAEDPANGFMPSPGVISALETPGGPGVRVDSAVYAGYEIPPFYDSMIGKLIVWGRDREETINRARRALGEYRIEGLNTTIPLHARLLGEEAFISGNYDTAYLEKLLGEG